MRPTDRHMASTEMNNYDRESEDSCTRRNGLYIVLLLWVFTLMLPVDMATKNANTKHLLEESSQSRHNEIYI